MKLVATFLFVLMVAGVAEAQQVRFFGDWWVLCDIQRTCTLLTGDDQSGTFLRLRRAGHATAALRDETLSQIGDRRGSPSAPIPPRYEESAGDPKANLTLWLTEASKKADVPASIQDGLSALSWLDEYQGRTGHPSALLLKGQTPDPDYEIPEPKSLAVPAQPLLSAPHIPPAALVTLVETPEVCGSTFDSTDADGRRYQAMRLSEKKVIWQVVCQETGFYQESAYYYDDDGEISPALIPMPNFQGSATWEETNILPNSGFNTQNLSLELQAFGSRTLDCPTLILWQWNGTEFEVKSYSIFPICGIPEEYGPDLLMPDPGEPNPYTDYLNE
jgi:hypothetical protein